MGLNEKRYFESEEELIRYLRSTPIEPTRLNPSDDTEDAPNE